MSKSQVSVKPAQAGDLKPITELDRADGGESRLGFFQKRLEAQQRHPEAFVSLVALQGRVLVGYLFAHLLEGEYGRTGKVAALDAIGVDPARRGRGTGSALLAELDRVLDERGVDELYSQAEWHQPRIADFLAATGFELAPRVVLERSAERTDF